MKQAITKLEDLLALELQALYADETSIKEKIKDIFHNTDCLPLLEILKKYVESSDHKRLKLDRVFSYIHVEPTSQGNIIMDKLLEEVKLRKKRALSDKIKNLVLINGLHRINHYKIDSYKTALNYSLELELDTVADLIHQILEWERKTDIALKALSLKEFSKNGAILQS